VPRARRHGVDRPRIEFSSIFAQLSFDDAPEDRMAVSKEDDRVGSILDWNNVIQGGLCELRFRKFRHVDMQELAQQLGSELGTIANQLEDSFMEERRHLHVTPRIQNSQQPQHVDAILVRHDVRHRGQLCFAAAAALIDAQNDPSRPGGAVAA
jgi:hypothetical protein